MPWRSELEALFPKLCHFNIPLAPLNSWGVGGPADCLFSPRTTDLIPSLFQFAKGYGLPLWFIGGGTNVLIPDEGLRGLTIHTGLLNRVTQNEAPAENDYRLICESGVPLKTLLSFSANKGLSGLEFMSGIPGTLGGALVGNAGASGKGIGTLVNWVRTIDRDGTFKTWHREDLTFSYRKSNLAAPGRMVLNCNISLERAASQDIARKIREQMVLRTQQPLGAGTAGCVFKNPEPFFAGKLLEECGCKGISSGPMIVSSCHANFFINRGQAQASDVWDLILECRKKVFQQTGILLSLEVKLLGESWK